ncbi:MAG TPA: GTPase ObgE [Acidimicrobiales bacterium]|nr:GTPase ObgE [Acidimicrobiales bacterium]
MSSFVDAAQLHAKAGNGGAGCVSFRREAHVAKGGPDGGDGGKGGDVWLVADHNQASLLGFRDHPFRRATDGQHGTSKRQHGARGKDLDVAVPVGTMVFSHDGERLVDLATAGERWLVARGGLGGQGNARFLSNQRRAPAFAEQGEVGEELWCNLELRLKADVALIGFPNVGKSTLIARVSAARPKIADYPFTTLVPNLGVVRAGARSSRPGDATEFVMADIPGLIEGAAEGRGLGHDFLRHVERARVLCVLLDLSELAPHSPEEQLAILLRELGDYQADLLERPRVIVGSKRDVAHFNLDEGFAISAATGEGVDRLVGHLGALVDQVRKDEATQLSDEIVIHRPLPEEITIVRDGEHSWLVEGRAALRAVRFQDLTDDEALAEVVHRLRDLGVDRSLNRAGVHDGDVVTVGGLSFEWWRDAIASGLDRGEHHRATRRERLARHGRLDDVDRSDDDS